MSWLINTTATPTLTIDGVDFSDMLVSMTVNDQSINNAGLMLTGGTIYLQEQPGGHLLEDYSKEKFGRGKIVLLDLTIDGVTRRHPRGHLYLLDSTYNPEQRTQELQVGCILTLYNLTDNIKNLRGFTVFALPLEAGFSDLDNALQTEGKFLWQDKNGAIVKRDFFDGDGGGSNKAPAAWVSVRDHTALASSPLGAGQIVPDKISVGYSWIEQVKDPPTTGATGAIRQLSVRYGGYGYTPNASKTMELGCGSGTGAKGTLTINADGELATASVTDGGFGYKEGDVLCFTDSELGGGKEGEVVVGDINPDEPNPDGKPYDEDLMESTYWLEHPAQIKKKQIVCQTLRDGSKDCREITVNDAKQTFSVKKDSTSRRNYGGPGGSVSTEYSITNGPAVELQGAYYAEYYAWEVARRNGNASGIKLKGLETITQNKTEKVYTYGEGGEVVKTVEYRYQSMLSAMTQNDWRPGGAETTTGYDPFNPPPDTGRGFLTTPPKNKMFLQSMVTTTYEYKDDATITREETLQSSAQCNGVGIFPSNGPRTLQNIDATNNGTKTTTKRTSRGGQLNPDQPPRNPAGDPDDPNAPPPGYSTVTRNNVYVEESAKYKPTSAGSVTFSTQMPYNNPQDTEAVARNRASNYAKHQRALVEGDAAGIRVAEAMRPEIFDYYPGMPFTYVDRQEEKVVKLRMNGSGWALNGSEALMSTDGCFIGLSNGTVQLGRNVPEPVDPGLRSSQRSAPYAPPVIVGENAIDLGRGDQPDVMEVIGVDIPVALGSYTGAGDDGKGIVPNWDEPLFITPFWNLQHYVAGEKISKEAQILHIDANGTIPENGDTILEGPSGILIPDLFDPNLEGTPEKIYFMTVGAPIVDQSFLIAVGPKPVDQVFVVETGAQPPDQTFVIDTRTDWQIDVAESPFMVTVFADPVPLDNIFEIKASARPADRIFDVTVMATPPESTPDGKTFVVVSGKTYEITTSYAVPDVTFLLTTGQRPAPDPDFTFNLSVGGPDAPPVPDPDVIFDVRTSWAAPDRFFLVKVMESLQIDVAEPPFMISTSAIPADQVFEMSTGAPPVSPENIFNVTTQAEGADRILNVAVVTKKDIRVNYSAVQYSVQDGEQGQYRVSGQGLIYAVNPELRGFTGQSWGFSIDCPANPFWISEVGDNSGTPIDESKATVLGQGTTFGTVRAEFHEPGTYYYASESPNGPVGTIIIESPFAADADQTFVVTRGPKAVDTDNVYQISTSAPPADVNHIVVVGAEAADQTFDVKVIERIIINAVDQVFDVAALDQVFDVTRVKLHDVTVVDAIEVAALDDLLNVEVSEP